LPLPNASIWWCKGSEEGALSMMTIIPCYNRVINRSGYSNMIVREKFVRAASCGLYIKIFEGNTYYRMF
jgi:hypothetical protein